MKELLKIRLKNLFVFTFLFAAMLMVSCSGKSTRAADEKFAKNRHESVENMTEIKNDIEVRIKYIEQELQDATGELKVVLNQSRKELEAQSNLLAEELEQVQAATLDTWNEVIKEASEATAKAKAKTNEVSKKVRENLDRQ